MLGTPKNRGLQFIGLNMNGINWGISILSKEKTNDGTPPPTLQKKKA